MKRIKKLFVNLIAVLMIVASCLSLTACKDVRTLKLDIQVYDYENNTMENVTMTVDLYAHLAPKTVDAIQGYVNEGYYNDAVFYQLDGYSSQIMLGDILDKDGAIEKNAVKPQLPGEFVRGGTVGSNLKNVKGSIGLWRDWFAYDENYKTNTSVDSGRATWYIPTGTSEISGYADWFCVFAQIDLANADNAKALNLITSAFSSTGNLDSYEIYYTGEYKADKVNEDYGLTFNAIDAVDFDEENIENLFVAEGAQYQSYNHHTVKIAKVPELDTLAAKIVSAKMA